MAFLSAEVHRYTVDRELINADFTPEEREEFWRAWAIDAANLTENEAALLFRHYDYRVSPRYPGVRDG